MRQVEGEIDCLDEFDALLDDARFHDPVAAGRAGLGVTKQEAKLLVMVAGATKGIRNAVAQTVKILALVGLDADAPEVGAEEVRDASRHCRRQLGSLIEVRHARVRWA